MDSLSYYKELKALVLPDSKLIDEINREILIAKDKKDREELSRLKAKKIYFKVIDPFLKTHQYIMSMRPHYFADIDKEISQMQVDPTAVIKDPVEIFDFLEKQDNPIDVLKVFCSASDYLSLSNAFYNSNREIAKQEFIALVSDKAKNVDVTKLSYYCAYISFFKEEMWNNEDDQIRDAIVSMSFGDECSSRLKELYECITPFYDDPSYKNFDNLYGAYFTNLLMTIFLLEHKPFSVEKELLINIFYNADDPDCISIYSDYLKFIFHIDIWEKIPEERKQIILQLPLAEELLEDSNEDKIEDNKEESCAVASDSSLDKSTLGSPNGIEKLKKEDWFYLPEHLRNGQVSNPIKSPEPNEYLGLIKGINPDEIFYAFINHLAKLDIVDKDEKILHAIAFRLSGYDRNLEILDIKPIFRGKISKNNLALIILSIVEKKPKEKLKQNQSEYVSAYKRAKEFFSYEQEEGSDTLEGSYAKNSDSKLRALIQLYFNGVKASSKNKKE